MVPSGGAVKSSRARLFSIAELDVTRFSGGNIRNSCGMALLCSAKLIVCGNKSIDRNSADFSVCPNEVTCWRFSDRWNHCRKLFIARLLSVQDIEGIYAAEMACEKSDHDRCCGVWCEPV